MSLITTWKSSDAGLMAKVVEIYLPNYAPAINHCIVTTMQQSRGLFHGQVEETESLTDTQSSPERKEQCGRCFGQKNSSWREEEEEEKEE